MARKRIFLQSIFLYPLLLCSLSWAQNPEGIIPSLNAKVTSLRFYESGELPKAQEQRDYKNRFERALTKRINWELGLEFPKSTQRRSLKIEEYWYDHKDRVLKHQFYDVVLEPNLSSSSYDHSFGWNRPGNWQNGSHRLDLHVDKKKVASGSFEIYEGSMKSLCDAVVGKWEWFTGGVVTINSDGTVEHKPENDGTWECTNATRAQFLIRWRLGGYINRMILSDDRQSLTSTDSTQSYVTAKRIASN